MAETSLCGGGAFSSLTEVGNTSGTPNHPETMTFDNNQSNHSCDMPLPTCHGGTQDRSYLTALEPLLSHSSSLTLMSLLYP